jgi:predicted nuclease of predicted toxin-antitoxin system
LAANIRFYLDENVPVAVATQLKRRQIEVVTARDLHALGDSDEHHFQRAAGRYA